MSKSPVGKVTQQDLVKVGKGALIAGAGALITYIAAWATSTDFGDATPVIVAIASVAVNLFRKWATAQKN